MTPTMLCRPGNSIVQNQSFPRAGGQPRPFSRRMRLSTKAWTSGHKQRCVVSHQVTRTWMEPHCWLNLDGTPRADPGSQRLYDTDHLPTSVSLLPCIYTVFQQHRKLFSNKPLSLPEFPSTVLKSASFLPTEILLIHHDPRSNAALP